MIVPEPDPDLDDATRLTARRPPAEPVDEATRLSTRRAPAEPVDEATRLSTRREQEPEVDEATRLSARRTPTGPAMSASVFPMGPPPAGGSGDAAARDTGDLAAPAHMTDGATGEHTDETILRSVRRTPAPGPEPRPGDPATGRTAYVPGDEASDRRPPRSPAAVMADRQPVVSPSSVAPAPAPEAMLSRGRRERRRLMLGAGIAVLVLAAAAAALFLLLI